MFTGLREALIEFGSWLLDVLEGAAVIVLTPVYAGLAGIIQTIPVPEAVSLLPTVFESVPPEALYMANMLWIGPGLTMFFGALTTRFILRRLPFIG
jgi:hypothetical protein